MNCSKCGNEMPENIPFCPTCGEPTELVTGQEQVAAAAAPQTPPADAAQMPGGAEQNPAYVQAPPQAYSAQAGQEAPASGAVPPAQASYTQYGAPPPQQGYSAPPPQGYAAPPAGQLGQPPVNGGWGAPPQQPYGAQPVPGAVPPPAPKGKGKTVGIVVAAIIVLVLAGVVGVLAMTGGSDAKGKVAAALLNSGKTVAGELDDTFENLGFGAFEQMVDSPTRMEIDMGFEVDAFYSGTSQVNVRVDTLVDLPQRRMDMEFSAGMAGASLLSGTVIFADDVIALTVPDLYAGTYGVRTTTLGNDYNKSNLRGYLNEDQVDGELGFNYFDMMGLDDVTIQHAAEGLQLAAEVTLLVKEFWDACEVTSTGKQNVSVNGTSRECEVFAIVAPKDATVTFLDGLVEYMESDTTSADELREMLEELVPGTYPEYGTDMAIYYLETVARELKGDITCNIYVDGDVAVKLDATIPMRRDMRVNFELGGSENLSDAFFVEVEEDGETVFEFSAKGSHAMGEGTFSTVVEVYEVDDYTGRLEKTFDMEIWCEPDKALDNLTVDVMYIDSYGDPVRVNIEGTVDVFEDGVSYDLYDILWDDDYNEQRVSLLFSVQPAEAADFAPVNATMLLDMKLLELTELEEEIEGNAEELLLRWMSLLYA